MLGLTIFGAALAYTALNLYLLAQIQPVPILFLGQTAGHRSPMRERVPA